MNKKLIATCAAVFLLAIVSVASILYLFYTRIYDRTADLYNERVALSANLNSKIVETKLYTYINVVSTTAETMKNQCTVLTPRNKEKITAIAASQPDFIRMGICDQNGTAWYTDGNVLNITNTKSFKATKNGNIFITDRFSSHLSPDEVFIISVPIIDDQKHFHGHVQATIPVKSFQEGAANINEFNVYKTSIIDSNLNYILHVEQDDESTYKSYKDRLEHYSKKESQIEIMDKIEKRVSFSKTFVNHRGTTTTVFYIPMNINDWYLLTYLDSSAVDEHIAAVLDKDIYYLVLVILLVVVFLSTVLAFYYYKAKQLIYNQEISYRNQLLSHASAYLEVNLLTNKIVRSSEAVNTHIKEIGDNYSLLFEYFIEHSIDEEYKHFVRERLSLKSLLQSYDSGIESINLEFIIISSDGTKGWREVEISFRKPEKDNDNILNAYMVIRDIDAQKCKELEFKEKAERDYLTGLYNREKGTELINAYLNSRSENQAAALAIFDVDNFKALNDTLGHNTGDMALKNVAEIMTRHFRQYDVVCRLAGDEFIVLLKDLPSNDVITKIITPLLYKLQLCYGTSDNHVIVSCSAGITLIDKNDKTFDDLYVKADKALYKAKHKGKHTFKIYQHM